MIIRKTYRVNAILSMLISIINCFYISTNLPKEIIKEEIVFFLYRNSIIREGIFYIIIPILIFICINIASRYLNIYSMVRYKNKDYILKNLIKDIALNNILFFIITNSTFIIYIAIKFNISYLNVNFIKYIIISFICQTIGSINIMLFIIFINFIIKKIILSSFIVFGFITLFKSITRMIKSNIITLDNMIFFKSDFLSYPSKIFFHVNYIVCFILILIFNYVLLNNIFNSKDILYD